MPPISDATRAAVLTDIRTGGQSARQIGRTHGISDATVRRIARAEGITDAWSRDKTEKATRARVADNAAKRAQLQSDLLDDAQKFRDRAWSKYKIAVAGPDGAEIVELELPPLPDAARAYTAIGIIVDKDRAYERDKSGSGGTDHARSMLGQLMSGLAEVFGDETDTPSGDG
jgi:hypothetical protein